jgi:hypothetical protein
MRAVCWLPSVGELGRKLPFRFGLFELYFVPRFGRWGQGASLLKRQSKFFVGDVATSFSVWYKIVICLGFLMPHTGLLLWPYNWVTLWSGLSRNVTCDLAILLVWGRQTASSDCLTLYGFPSASIKMAEGIVLRLLQCIFVLLNEWSELLLVSYCSELYVINICFIVIKYLLFWYPAFSCPRLNLEYPIPSGEQLNQGWMQLPSPSRE